MNTHVEIGTQIVSPRPLDRQFHHSSSQLLRSLLLVLDTYKPSGEYPRGLQAGIQPRNKLFEERHLWRFRNLSQGYRMLKGTFCKMGLEGIYSPHVMVHPSHFRTPMWTAAHSEVGSSLIDLKSA